MGQSAVLVGCVGAHPRRCGEHHLPGRASRPGAGLIPAGAGNMRVRRRRVGATRAHPRRCGEHRMSRSVSMGGMGSSPQVRGTFAPTRHARGVKWLIPAGAGNIPTHRRHPQSSPGLIPAGAGNITARAPSTGLTGAHPRRCGEHPSACWRRRRRRGSSPQVRGTWSAVVCRARPGGLIPAGAGNIDSACHWNSDTGAHPRRCGEHHRWCGPGPLIPGSSPQVRGTSCGASPSDTAMAAHPRRCGEHGRRGCFGGGRWGSSPQVRGTSAWPAHRRRHDKAHPRRCGEHRSGGEVYPEPAGSSPQVRGTYSLNWEYYALAECSSPVAVLSRFTSGIATSVMPS